jgi:hypothetical protein
MNYGKKQKIEVKNKNAQLHITGLFTLRRQ